MSAAWKDISCIRKGRVLLASLCLLSSLALAQDPALDSRLEEIREVGRFLPPRALDDLLKIEPQARAAGLGTRADFLELLSIARRQMGDPKAALVLADELLALGQGASDDVVIAKGLLSKAYATFALSDLKGSHKLAWEAERVANRTVDLPLRIRVIIVAGQAHAEDGNFPAALGKMQTAVALARQHGKPVQLVIALNALAFLYGQMKEYDKGFETLEEAVAVAEAMKSPGRLSILKGTEYGLAVDSNQPQRAHRALLAGLAYQRQIGAEHMIAGSLVDLSDSYLKQHDYVNTIAYGTQALAAARKIADRMLEATAHVNIGQGHLGQGRVAEGKRHFEAGLAWYVKQND